MNIKVTQLASKPTAQHPYNYRVLFAAEPEESRQVGEWIEDQKLVGSTWVISGSNRVFYTTEGPALLCLLKWT